MCRATLCAQQRPAHVRSHAHAPCVRLHSAIASKTASLARLPFEDLLRCWPDEGLGTWWSRLAHAYDLARGESYVPRARGARWPVQQPGAASDAARRMLAGLYYATAPLVVAPGDGMCVWLLLRRAYACPLAVATHCVARCRGQL